VLFTPKLPATRPPDESPSEVSFMVETTPPRPVRRRDRAFKHGLLAADILAALLAAAVTWNWTDSSGDWLLALLPGLVPLVHAANGLYERDEKLINKTTLDEAPSIFHSATLVTVLAVLVQTVLLHEPFDAAAVATIWLGLAAAVTACRTAARAIVRDAMPPERCLVVGDHDLGHRLARRLCEEPKVKVELAGVVALPDAADALETHQCLAAAVSARDVHRVVLAAGAGPPQQELQAIQAAKALGVKVSVVPRVLEVIGSSAAYDYIDGLTVLGIPRFGLSSAAHVTKRGFDLAGSLLLSVLGLPLLLAIAAAVKLSSPGPVLFRQSRIGRGGEPFSMLKFRSMYDDADRLKDQLRPRNEADGLFKIADDPRITRVGRVLRRSSLDELPQLWNVLRGEMSLVGPRPLVPEEDGMIQGWHRRRLQLTPGITGPWQVLGSARIPLREMVAIDYQYVGNWSLWADIKILLRTVGVVVARRGR
jgi:exopolysaccharide biosynthesis polyprenyl glycosylphosphotransferase